MRPRQQPTLWEVSVQTTPDGEGAVAELLGQSLRQPSVCSTNLLTRRSRVSVYLETKHLPNPAVRAGLNAALGALPGLSAATLRVTRVRREDWTESWKRHFPPLEIGRDLLIRPSWSRRRGRTGQAVVTLDPGLSFGTGQHATTGFCLRQLVASRRADETQACLDVGTGSGILAIAAAKLGYAPVEAFDFDPLAVRVARENAAANGVLRSIALRRGDATRLPPASRKTFDIVCANLLADLLIQVANRLVARVSPAGRLVAAGILREEFDAVARAFGEAGMRLVASRVEKEWRSGAFEHA